jgi:preprotein translocase subunit SecD
MPDLRNLQLSGGSLADAQNFNVPGNLGIDLSGGSRVTMSGQATDLTATGSGGSNFNLEDLQANDASVDLSGGSQCRVNISGRLDAMLSGGSQLHYKGNPTLGEIDSSGGSIISSIT